MKSLPRPKARSGRTGPGPGGRRDAGPRGRLPARPSRRYRQLGLRLAGAGLLAGAGFPWFAFVLVPSAIGVGSWARQGRREAATR